MIDAKLEAEIRRLFFAEHYKIGTIETALGVHHDAVRRAIFADRFIRTRESMPWAQLEPFKALVKKTLEVHPRLRATRLYAMLAPRGYKGSVVCLRRYVRTIRRATNAEAYLRLETLAGEQAQVDWAHFGKVAIGSATRTLSCFVLILSHSRRVFARFFLDQTMENFLRGHTEAFAAIGGVPRNILYDNLKSVVLDRVGDHIRFHPRLLELCGHYHFAPKPCAPYRGNEKGKVERSIHYIRYSFFEGRTFRSLETLNHELAEWLSTVSDQRKILGMNQTVGEVFASEAPMLLPLPENPLCVDFVGGIASGKTPYVRFDSNDYSIPHTLIKKPLTLIASEHAVRLLDGQCEIALHQRSYDRGKRIENNAHIQALAKQKRAASELRGRDRLRQACLSTDAMLEAAVHRSEPLSAYTQALTRLLDDYGACELECAMLIALEKGAIGVSSLAHILERRHHASARLPPLGPLRLQNPAAQALRVTTHSLKDYDMLSDPKEENET